MSLTARLGRLDSPLSGKERALLVIKAALAGEEADPSLRIIDDELQRKVFDRYVGLLYVCNVVLGSACQSILFYARRLEQEDLVAVLRRAAVVVEEEMGEEANKQRIRSWRKRPTVTLSEYLYGLAEEVAIDLISNLQDCWRELRALEMVWDELADEFRRPAPSGPVDPKDG